MRRYRPLALACALPLLVLSSLAGGAGVVEEGFRIAQMRLLTLPRQAAWPEVEVVAEAATAATLATDLTAAKLVLAGGGMKATGTLSGTTEPPPAKPLEIHEGVGALRVVREGSEPSRKVDAVSAQPVTSVRAEALPDHYAAAFLAVRAVERGLRPAYEAASCFKGEADGVDAGIFIARGDGPALDYAVLSSVPGPEAVGARERADFGRLLAEAALAQTRRFTVYNGRYFDISFPGGDIPGLYGVCTDVVVRAYRDLGIDLQKDVRKAGITAGGPALAHRRTVNLRRFFSRVGASLPVSEFGEDYAPGDIVTYDRPQNSGSRHHIAVVTDIIGPSGDPMIVHNRGWGPQLEDALFVDRITGHYRYRGGAGAAPEQSVAAAARTAKPGTGRAAGASRLAEAGRRAAAERQARTQ